MNPPSRVLLLLILSSLLTGAVPAVAQVLYSNGPTNGNTDAWNIGSGFQITDSVCCRAVDPGAPLDQSVTGFQFAAWLSPGDVISAVQVTLSSDPFGAGVVYFIGNVGLTQSGCNTNGLGFDVCTEAGGFTATIPSGSNPYWLTLQNGEATDGDPVYWDENSGPSSAMANNGIGTIPSESFTIFGSTGQGSIPEPGSMVLFATSVVALAGGLRRKFW